MTERDGDERDHGHVDETFDETRASSQHPTPTGVEQDGPSTDLSAIQADDALLDALSGSDPRVADGIGDQELNALLLAWRRDVDSEPLAELVDAQTAASTVKAAVLARRRDGRARRRMLVPAAAAAAVLAIGSTGTALAARDAQPGDTLWGLSKVLYADYARSVEAAASVRTDLQNAYLAIAQERYEDARQALRQAEQSLRQVTVEGDLVQLKARHTELMEQLEEPQDTSPQSSPTTTTGPTSSSTETQTSVIPPTSSEPVQSSAAPDDTSTGTTTEQPTSTTPSSSSPTGDTTNTESGGNARFGVSVPEAAEPTS